MASLPNQEWRYAAHALVRSVSPFGPARNKSGTGGAGGGAMVRIGDNALTAWGVVDSPQHLLDSGSTQTARRNVTCQI
jgi:hypothetical protein